MAGPETPALESISRHVRGRLAVYKPPRELVLAPVARAANCKLDYQNLRKLVLETLRPSTMHKSRP